LRSEPETNKPEAPANKMLARTSGFRYDLVDLVGLAGREIGKSGTAERLSQLQQPASLNLPNPLTSNAVESRHFIESFRKAVPQAEPKLDHLALARRQGTKDFNDAFLEQPPVGVLAGGRGFPIAQEILEHTLAVVAHRIVQTDGLPAHNSQRASFLGLHAKHGGNLL
jgi:hypothetical protein